jgi:hypothetical protein
MKIFIPLMKADNHQSSRFISRLSSVILFVLRTVPTSTYGQRGIASGYFFEDDAGVQFNSSEEFINQSYSLAFNFHIDEFISLLQWVRLLNFTHIDDHGIYIKLTSPPDYGTEVVNLNPIP